MPTQQAKHVLLFAGLGFEPAEDTLPLTELPVITGSRTDQSIVARIADFLRSPVVDVPFAHRTPAEHYIKRLTEMYQAMQVRASCSKEDLDRFVVDRARRKP